MFHLSSQEKGAIGDASVEYKVRWKLKRLVAAQMHIWRSAQGAPAA